MHKMSRGTFLRMGAVGIAATLAPPRLWRIDGTPNTNRDEALLKRLITQNDLSVSRSLTSGNRMPGGMYFRSLGEEFAAHTASYCQAGSQYYRSDKVLPRMDAILASLIQSQYPNGMLDSGGNRQSPPDTAFLMDHLCPAAKVLQKDGSHAVQQILETLRIFLTKVGEGLKTGGVHTPNHRWEVASALAQLHSIINDGGYVERIDEWLDEGIDINDDGNYSERSRIYAVVADWSLWTIGRLLDRPALLTPVRKNLETTYYYMETNGELVTIDSRRQDQNSSFSILSYYLLYRSLAIHDGDESFAAIANLIETFPEFERRVLSRSLIFFLENPLLLTEVTTNKRPEQSFAKVFPQSGLARIRRQEDTASIFGGNDKPVIVASGRSTNPDFLTVRKGSAILDYARMSTNFFGTGYFRSDGVQHNGNTYTLHETKDAFYFQPLPKGKRKMSGDYILSESTDGRFWSKMDFASRPTTQLVLDSTITIQEDDGRFDLRFAVDGPHNVEVSIELCFRSGGTLEGVTSAGDADDYFLIDGFAKYSHGNDVIEIGPGRHEHANIRMLDGEEYTTHFGTIKGRGMHVYITGLVPFTHTMTIR